ncbi:glutathione synthase [Pricia sp. S334]|uniref:Glutathione synthase n=1 Tax=Pricia mediterranea TaxID=3076079 RepID=A0ABU3L3T7_9FLAO|nr:glutathione synthase [Pricia sp. S334]MDT7827971.1 glutathione synthase [Pricia sp. S334]
MKICFVLSDLNKEYVGTSSAMLKKAFERDHTVYIMEVGGFNFVHGSPLDIRCKKIPKSLKDETHSDFLDQIKSDKLEWETISSDELEVLFVRNNPTEEPAHRKWAEHSGLAFARAIQQQGVLVLNDANAMAHSFIDKMYFEELPKAIKPKSVITRDKQVILDFWKDTNKKIVLKPLEGSGGQDIYLIGKEKANFEQITDALLHKGYVIAQEFLPGVSKGDVRVLLMNGKILEQDGELGLIRRINSDADEFRSNLALGGRAEKAELTPEIERIVELTGPKLIRDGFFFVGLDVVDDKLIEINCMSPGGLAYTEDTGLPDFSETVIESIERKVEYKQLNKNELSNKELATMD